MESVLCRQLKVLLTEIKHVDISVFKGCNKPCASVVSLTFLVIVAFQAGYADSSWTPGPTYCISTVYRCTLLVPSE